MESISWKYVTSQGGDANGIVVPLSVDYYCPFCGRLVNFTLGWTGTMFETYVSGGDKCKACSRKPVFVYSVVSHAAIDGSRIGHLFVYPNGSSRKPLSQLDKLEAFPQYLSEEYDAVVRIYNQKEWIAASVMCRRVLEGLIQHLTPDADHTKSLYAQIKDIDNYVDLQKPIKDIANVLRIAGNKGAHFDPLNKPDAHTLELMLDLIDSLIEYFYLLPTKTANLFENVNQLR